MRHVVVRDERGLASGFADENGAVVAEVERDERGAFVGVILREADPGPALASAEDLEQLSQELRSAERQTAEVAQILDLRTERLSRRLDVATTPPVPPTLEEYQARYRLLSQRLGNRRDASELHLGLLGAVTAFGQGDLVRAVGALRAIEGAP